MKRKLLTLTAIVMMAGLASGCSTYMIDRGRDAADIFTVAAGIGVGARARVGPFHIGAFGGGECVGLQAGELYAVNPLGSDPGGAGTVDLTFLFNDTQHSQRNGIAAERGKSYEVWGYPFLVWLPRSEEQPLWIHPYNTQIEVAGGLLGSVRLGFNPGELLDFILGWVGVDIYNDDLEVRKKREEAANP